MNLFDLVAALVLVVSALIGFSRGAVLEIVTLFAFTAAATLSVYLLPFTAPVARHTVHPPWAANAVAVAVSFLVAYIGLRLLGSNLSRAIRSQSTLGTLDRSVGLAFGVVRALVVMGVVYLVFNATPFGQPPPLLTSARLYPLARGAGLTLASVAPGGLREMEGFGAGLKARMGGGDPGPPPGPVEAGQDYAEPAVAAPPSERTLRIDDGSAPHRHRRRPVSDQVE
ncbi:CvpA family protein [Caulobacter sp. S45]|uniref:CvpA family protein n=1 Tax=Caulobacter sp. S45 TaxID=1641861 RepID=UPI001575B1B7|nr:CvpA family protein [Caulobacter sp. S45]